MNRFFSIILVFPISFLLALSAIFIKYQRDSYSEFQELRLSAAANRANDAALITAQIDGHLDTYERATIKPNWAWYAYKKVLLNSFQIASESNIQDFDYYAPAVLIAVNDGYFVHMKDVANEYRFSQKIPYARNEGGTYYADTMNGTYIYTVNSSVDIRGEGIAETDSPGNIHDTVAIKQELVGAMSYLVEEANVGSHSWGGKRFYLPKQFLDDTLYSAVTFKGLSFMVLIQDFDLLPGNKLDFHTVSNTQLVPARKIACYGDLYCWLEDYVGEPKAVYNTPDEAAKNGYNPDPNKFR